MYSDIMTKINSSMVFNTTSLLFDEMGLIEESPQSVPEWPKK